MMRKWLPAAVLGICVFVQPVSAYAFDTAQNSDRLLLVSKNYPITEEYVPENMQDINTFMDSTKSSTPLRKDAYEALENMYQDMAWEGIDLLAISGYRSYEYQTGLFQREWNRQKQDGSDSATAYRLAAMQTAVPGGSEHQTGLAIDVSTNSWLSQNFGQTEAGKWLKDNCYRYGFILRYAQDKQNITNIIYEPWHFRYVGYPHAKYMTENNLCLEEYLALLEEKGQLQVEDYNLLYTIYYTTDTQAQFDEIVDISRDNRGGWVITTCHDRSMDGAEGL